MEQMEEWEFLFKINADSYGIKCVELPTGGPKFLHAIHPTGYYLIRVTIHEN